ncbi:MAG: leucine-rich repeat domain-containing protein [Clostridiales bacterium]|nr:leucine-rich repeat domain-containing protein [Clostridiales bacterium]
MERKTTSVALRTAIAAICVFLLCVISAVTVFGMPKKTTAEEVDPALAEGVSQWDGDLIAAGWNGEESVTKPTTYDVDDSGKTIKIRDAAAFAWFAHEIYKDTANDLDGYTVMLKTDINLAGNMWIPIGQTGRQNALGKGKGQSRFSGTFDGEGHTIYNFDTTKLIAALQSGSGNNLVYTYAGEKNYTNKTATIPLKTRSGEYSYGLFASAYDVTVKNLNIDGVKIDFSDWVEKNGLTSDSIAAIIGYCTGDVTVENCTVGANTHFNNIIKAVDGDGGIAGIIGRVYAYDGNASIYTKVSISNCVNYADIDVGEAARKPGGIVGHLNYAKTSKVEGCVNYGNIDGGAYVGGVVGYWTPNNSSGVNNNVEKKPNFDPNNKSTDAWLIDCDNYGKIVSKKASIVGGVANIYRNTTPISLVVDGCNNYGNIGGNAQVGGILGDVHCDTANTWTVLTNNYNYGDVYSYGTTFYVNSSPNEGFAGGYIGRFAYSSDTSKYNLIITGGNLGTVYGAAPKIGSIYGVNDKTASDKVITKDGYLVAAGKVVKKSVEEMQDIEVPDSNTAVEHARNFDALKKVGKYTYTLEGESGAYREKIEYKLTYEYSYKDSNFAYAKEDDHTTIIGYVGEGGAVEIPATVEKIAYGAFAGHSEITEITFAKPAMRATVELEIEDFAFAGTGIGKLELPANLTKIGAGAFAGIDNLNYIVLSENAADIEFGTAVFSNTRKSGATQTYLGAYLIAADNAQYWALRSSGTFDDYLSTLTHEMTIKFVNGGETLGKETKLYGQSYKVSNEGGMWTAAGDEDVKFGPTGYQDKQWLGADNSIFTAVNADQLLLTDADTVTLSLFEPAAEGKKSFIARAGLVYDKNKTYKMNELNSLLHASSTQITADMEANITKYNDSTSNLPNVIHNAGTYEISVVVPSDESSPYTFTVTIAKATLDLSNLSNLEWNIVQVGSTGTRAQLMSYTLYMYTYKDGDAKVGEEYPSRDMLTAEQIKAYNLNNSYRTQYVDYSVARMRGDDVTITIGIVGDGYTTASIGGNTGNAVGAYTATAQLTAGVNYVFTEGNVSALRGMDIKVTNNGNTATVTKDWYIVNISNWLVGSGGAEYTVSNHIYGDTEYSVVAPALAFGTSDKITMHLLLDGNEVGDTSGFGVGQIAEYINYVMPAGNYTLRIDVAGLEAEDPEDQTVVWHNAFSETLSFTVEKAELPAAELAALIEELTAHDQDNPYVYDVTDTRIFDADAEAKVNALTGKTANLDRSDTVWKNSDKYGSFVVEYNLSRWQNDKYSASLLSANQEKLDPDTYTVYFRVSAPNYKSSTDGEDRFAFKFTLVKYETIKVPTVSSAGLEYTGSRVTPTLTESPLYAIMWSSTDTYISGGSHNVYFKLYDFEHYRWQGVDGDTVAVSYTIGQAKNEITVSLNMLGWRFEEYDADINSIRFAVKYLDGDVLYSVFREGADTAEEGLNGFTVDSNGKVSPEVAERLKNLPTGTYALIATVESTPNYKGLSPEVSFVVAKAMNSWAYGNDDLVLPGWIVGQYNAKDNPIVVKAAHGKVNIKITDINGKVYYDSEKGINKLNDCKVGKYLLTAWVNETDDFAELAPRTFTIEVFEKVGLPWWATLIIVIAALGIAALIIFILWKKGVFEILTEKLMVAIRTRADIDATIAAVRAAKREDEAKRSVKAAEAKERAEARKLAAQAERELPPEERAAAIEARAKLQAEKAEKMRLRAEKMHEHADKVRRTVDKGNAVEVEVEPSAEATAETPVAIPESTSAETPVGALEAPAETPAELAEAPAEAAATQDPKPKKSTTKNTKNKK